jgi:chromate reductase, NAD(P)H dehydrogenase (quinone)
VNVLAISGSLRRDSYNTRLLRILAEEAPEDVTVELWDGLKAIPPYDSDDDGPLGPDVVEDFRRRVREADAVLIATPEYNASIPGQLKNALDWGSRPLADSAFRNKPVAVIASSMGMFGAVWAAAELRKVLGTMGARVVTDVELTVPRAHEQFDDDGALVGNEIRASLRQALATLVESATPATA